MHFSKSLLSLPLMLGLVGCSTITSGTTQPLTVETPHVSGASCTLTDSRSGTWRIENTPDTREVRKGDGPMKVTCQKSGYKTTSLVVQERFAGATLGNIIIGGGIGLVVDAASGAAQDYPDVVRVYMEPNSFSSAKAKEDWMTEKAAYENSLKPNAGQQQQTTPKSTGNFNK